MADEPDERLTFATNDELIDELARRSNCLVFAALLKSDELPDGEGLIFDYRGGIFTAMGVVVEIGEQLKAIMRKAPGGDE